MSNTSCCSLSLYTLGSCIIRISCNDDPESIKDNFSKDTFPRLNVVAVDGPC